MNESVAYRYTRPVCGNDNCPVTFFRALIPQALADKAHEVCPYSNATRGNIDVKVSVVED